MKKEVKKNTVQMELSWEVPSKSRKATTSSLRKNFERTFLKAFGISLALTGFFPTEMIPLDLPQWADEEEV